jgi:hypothetical protein
VTGRLSPAALAFKKRLLAAVDIDPDRFNYITPDRVSCPCPCCDGTMGVRFDGAAPRATLVCHGSCSEAEILAVLARKAAKRCKR